MKRRFQGLHRADQSAAREVPDGLFLVRVQRAQYRWHAQKPFYLVRLVVLEPRQLEGRTFSCHLYCMPRALWKLTWFLRDFGYDLDLLGHDEVDERHLIGLRGVVKISHTGVNGTTVVNLDGFAEVRQWNELSDVLTVKGPGPEAA